MEGTGKSIAIVAIKGGIGKTTVSVNLANMLGKDEKTILLDVDPSPKAHMKLLDKIGKENLIEKSSDVLVKPNILYWQEAYEANKTAKENRINDLKRNPEFAGYSRTKLEEIAAGSIGRLDILSYSIPISENFEIIGGGKNLRKYNALSENKELIRQLDQNKGKYNWIYDTAAGVRSMNDLTLKLMDQADRVILVSDLDMQAQADAYRMGELFLLYKFGDLLSKSKKNIEKILKITKEPAIDEENYLDIAKSLENSPLKDAVRLSKWYNERLKTAQESTNLYVIMNRIKDRETIDIEVDGKIQKLPEPFAAELYFSKLHDELKKRGVNTYCLGLLPESRECSKKRLIGSTQTDIENERTFVTKLFYPKTLYEGFSEIADKIKNNTMMG